jgi:hypothetical protein
MDAADADAVATFFLGRAAGSGAAAFGEAAAVVAAAAQWTVNARPTSVAEYPAAMPAQFTPQDAA